MTRVDRWRPWQQAWQQALYGAHGFYRRTEGPAGHFATSVQGTGPVGEELAAALVSLARRHGLRHVVDVGSGRGELLTQLAALDPDLDLTGVDVVTRPAGIPPRADWLVGPGGAELPERLQGLSGVLVVAHEWLDVVPCAVVEADEQAVWRVVHVDDEGAERRGAPLPAEGSDWLHRWWPPPRPGDRAEVGTTRDRAFADLLSRVHHGLVLAIDYGHTATARPPRGTLTAYRSGTQVQPRPDGSCDLTAHVAVDSLGADLVLSQREAVTRLLGPPPPVPHALAATDPAGYLAALSRRSARTALTDPHGLGAFWWAMSGAGGVDLG